MCCAGVRVAVSAIAGQLYSFVIRVWFGPKVEFSIAAKRCHAIPVDLYVESTFENIISIGIKSLSKVMDLLCRQGCQLLVGVSIPAILL